MLLLITVWPGFAWEFHRTKCQKPSFIAASGFPSFSHISTSHYLFCTRSKLSIRQVPIECDINFTINGLFYLNQERTNGPGASRRRPRRTRKFSGQSALAPFAGCTFLELVLILQNSRPIKRPAKGSLCYRTRARCRLPK